MARGEGYPSPEQHEERFRLYKESEDGGDEPVELPLLPIDAATKVEVGKWAKQFLQERANLSSRKRVVDARIQNRLLRVALGGEGYEATTKFQEAVNAALATSSMNEREKDEMRVLLGRVAVGVRSNMEAVSRVESLFKIEAKNASPDSVLRRARQEICTNDDMDAGDKVDLVALQHYETDDGEPKVARIDLIQVKTGTLTPAEQQEIHDAHASLYRSLVEKAAMEDRMQEAALREAIEASFDLKETKEAGTAAEMFDAADHLYGDFILAYAAEAPSMDGADVLIIKSIEDSGIDAKLLAIAAQVPGFEDVYSVLAVKNGASPELIERQVRSLQQWAKLQEVGPADVRRLDPDRKPLAPVIGNAEFRSVIMTGGSNRSVKMLLGPERALTKK